MIKRFNWRAGIFAGIILLVVGGGLFIFVGSSIDYSCKNNTPRTAGCRIYNDVNTVIQGYSDIWRSIFARRCLGGNGPDDCIGPDAMIMIVTLLAVGFIGGGLVLKRKVPPGLK
jgi:hypothetical protein